VSTCFLFVNELDDENCLSLRLNDKAQIDAPLMLRTIDEIKELQVNAKTIVVLATLHSTLYEVELPKLNSRKLRAAIPYALEDQLTQPLDTLHFAFDRHHYHNNCYLVVVTDKAWLLNIIQKLHDLNIAFDLLTLDWFALNHGEACIYEAQLLVHDGVFKGVLSTELLPLYVASNDTQKFAFQDSIQINSFEPNVVHDELGAVWIAQRLLRKTAMNLCQGDLWRMCRKSQNLTYWYYAGIGLLCAYFISIIGSNLLILSQLNKYIQHIDQETSIIYHEFFPKATNVINPKLQINQYLAQHTSSNSELWLILDALTKFIHNPDQIESLRFQASRALVTLSCVNFAALEKLEENLKNAQLRVVQTEAAVRGDHVVAILEISK
jgi:general secretion pathway protein L